MLGAILLVAVLLAILETGYVHIIFFKGKLIELLRLLLPLTIVGVCLCAFEMQLGIWADGYLSFIAYGAILACINAAVALIVGFIFNRRELLALTTRFLHLLKR